jgi:hypothetical protein
MKILLVAPRHPDLSQIDNEVQDIINSGNQVTPLLGEVTHAILLRATYEGDFDVLWLCTHGGEDGVLLSDGPLNVRLLSGIVRESFQLVVINSCTSIQLANNIHQNTGCRVVCTITDVEDKEAYQVGAIFANLLADSGVVDAYNTAKTGNPNYVLIGEEQPMHDMDRVSMAMDRLTSEVHQLEQRILLLEYQIKQMQMDMAKNKPLSSTQVTALILGFATLSLLAAILISWGLP